MFDLGVGRSRAHFESLIANMSNAANAAPGGADGAAAESGGIVGIS